MMMLSPPRVSESAQSLGYGDYLRLSKLVRDRCGLHFSDKRRTDLERGIQQAFAASTCTNLDEYYHLLQDPSNGVVHMERLVNALTVGETHFFRDAAQFEILYNHVLPQIIERRQELRTLRIWSAGCASGEEPYSIAIVLRELLPDVDEWSITILGTDINTEALDRARKAVYGEWAFREERAKRWRSIYFRRRDNRYELIPEVRRMVTLARLNLTSDRYPAYETNTTLMDLILCRNVMMYFTDPDAQRIVERFYHALTDGGWMLVGHAEHSLVTYHRFQVHTFPDTILYRRSDQMPLMPRDWHWLAPPPKVDEPAQPHAAVSASGPVLGSTDARSDGQSPPDLRQEELSADDDPVQRARELLDYGHSVQARELLLKVAQQEPHHTLACTLLGRAYANLGHWQEAEKWCRQAVQLDKLALDAYYTLALVLQHQGMLQEAIDAMRKVVYIDRHNVLGHFGLADLYHSSGQLPLALKSLDNALRLLETCPEKELIPGSGGITAGGLRGAIVGQQQRWSAEDRAS
jgi:chemotaxis protein methyltransferase CheR